MKPQQSLADFAKSDDLAAVNRRLQAQLIRARAKTEDLVAAVKQAGFDAMLSLGPVTPVEKPTYTRSNKHVEVALWHMTDWQGSKLTPSYNTQVMKERVLRFTRKSGHISNIQRNDHPVKDVVIAFGGDMVEGLFNFPTQAFEVDQTIFGQYKTVSRLIIDVVREALLQYEHVHVVPEWGNHGRIGSKRDNVPRSDNIDRMCYELAKEILEHIEPKRVSWQDCPEDIQRLEVGEYRALVIHGDEAGRNGFVADTQMVTHTNKWKAGSYPWDFRDVYIGHYHQHKELPMANGVGALYWSGSTESDNRYASVGMAASSIPSQRLHFIDPVRGRVSAQYKIYLDAD